MEALQEGYELSLVAPQYVFDVCRFPRIGNEDLRQIQQAGSGQTKQRTEHIYLEDMESFKLDVLAAVT